MSAVLSPYLSMLGLGASAVALAGLAPWIPALRATGAAVLLAAAVALVLFRRRGRCARS